MIVGHQRQVDRLLGDLGDQLAHALPAREMDTGPGTDGAAGSGT